MMANLQKCNRLNLRLKKFNSFAEYILHFTEKLGTLAYCPFYSNTNQYTFEVSNNKKYLTTLKNKVMKNLIKSIAMLVLTTVITFANAKANEKPNFNASIAENVVSEYIAASTKGQTLFVNQLFTKDFVLKYDTNSEQADLNKKQIVELFQSQKGLVFNCDANYQILEKSSDYMIAKVVIEFETFKRFDYISLSPENGNWKIKEVSTRYSSKKK